MPKKIRRSNNRLKKTNRKVRKTANRNRLKKFKGGRMYQLNMERCKWKNSKNGYTIDDMEVCRDKIGLLISSSKLQWGEKRAIGVTLTIILLEELHTYLSNRITECTIEYEKFRGAHTTELGALLASMGD